MADRHTEELRTFAHLADLLASEFPRGLFERRLRVVVGPDVLNQDAGQALVLTIARLAPRFCHRIDFASPSQPCLKRLRPLLAAKHFGGSELAELARLVWPDGDFTAQAGGPSDVTIGIGAPGDVTVGIDTDGAALISRGRVLAIGRGDAVFAALTAAAVACAIAAKQLYPGILGEHSTSDLRLELGPLGGPLNPNRPILLERPVLAGVGAVGCAALYALLVAGATGSLLLLDPDVVNDSNLMRYVLFDSRHVGMAKIVAARDLVVATGLALVLEGEQTVIQEYLKQRPVERGRLELVMSAVDTYEARREITGELPHEIVNAGTTPRDFTVSRHGFADGFACLACLYPPLDKDTELSAVISREVGLEKHEVDHLRRTKQGLTAQLLRRIAEARAREPGHFDAYIGEPLDSFYNKEVCATTSVQTQRGEAIAPLAYGSALAGFFLAHATILPREALEARRFRLDFHHGLSTSLRTSPRPRPRCLYCGRRLMRAVYRNRWSGEGQAQT
jgi:hypothetical protein